MHPSRLIPAHRLRTLTATTALEPAGEPKRKSAAKAKPRAQKALVDRIKDGEV